MTQEGMLYAIGIHGYALANIRDGKLNPAATLALADPQDDADGLYLEVESIAEAFNELRDIGIFESCECDSQEDSHV